MLDANTEFPADVWYKDIGRVFRGTALRSRKTQAEDDRDEATRVSEWVTIWRESDGMYDPESCYLGMSVPSRDVAKASPEDIKPPIRFTPRFTKKGQHDLGKVNHTRFIHGGHAPHHSTAVTLGGLDVGSMMFDGQVYVAYLDDYPCGALDTADLDEAKRLITVALRRE